MKISSHFGKPPTGPGAQGMGNRRERKYRRFRLECPIRLKFRAANRATEVETISRNLSIGGLLVNSAAMIPEHTPVTFIISVLGEQAVRPIYLAGEGKIVRVEHSQVDATFAIAVECKTPIMQIGGDRVRLHAGSILKKAGA